MLQRMQASLNSLLGQLEKYSIESELILVDWNPPADKPPLKDIVKWPVRLRYCTVRVIVVPPSIHRRYKYADRIPMKSVIAINCGIRRARGQFILSSVIDSLYSDKLIAYIASKSLKEDKRYRVDRYDVNRSVLQYDTLKEQMDYCGKNIIRICTQVPWWLRWTEYGLPHLHIDGCGDFQLMARYYWHLLRGYREADIIAASVDALLSYASYVAGVREVALKNPIRSYHIDHDNKFDDKIKRTKLPFENWLSFPFLPAGLNHKIITLYRMFMVSIGYKIKSSAYGVPTLDASELLKMYRDIIAGRCSYILNDENWGLGQESLEESIISTANWDKERLEK